MPNESVNLPEVIGARLNAFVRRRGVVRFWSGLAEVVLVFGCAVLAVALLLWVWRIPLAGRVGISAAIYLGAFLWLVLRAIAPLLRRAPLRQIALEFEAAAKGRFQERVSSAVELVEAGFEPGVSSWMKQQTVELAAREIENCDPTEWVPYALAIRRWKAVGILAAVFGLALLLPGFAPRAWLAVNPRASTAPLSRVRLSVSPGNCRLKLTSPLDVKVQANTAIEEAALAVKWQDGFAETVPMSRVASNAFALSLPPLTQGLIYTVRASDAESGPYTVYLEVPPRIARAHLEIAPPAYTGWSNRVVEGGSADILEGSKVDLKVQTTAEPIIRAELIAEGQPVRSFALEDRLLTIRLEPTNTLVYQVRLVGTNGLESEPSPRWSLRLAPDLPPTARLAIPGSDASLVQRDELLKIDLEAADDVGLKQVEMAVLNQETALDLKMVLPAAAGAPTAAAPRSLKQSLTYSLADLDPVAGDELQFQVLATDLRGQLMCSDPVRVSIGARQKAIEARLAERLGSLASALAAQMEHLRQTRSSWQSIMRNYRDEAPEAQRPAIAVVESRLEELSRGVREIGDDLVAASETNQVAEARLMYRLGTTINTWSDQQREVLLESCRSATDARGTNLYAAFSQARQLLGRATQDLEQYKHVISVVQAFYQTDVLNTQCEGAQGRYKRALPLLRGQPNPDSQPLTGPGLLATFFEGTSLEGALLERKVANPQFSNYPVGERKENWSARYQGELNITRAGDWTLACLADDGVRLLVDGKSVLPDSAWSLHAATLYRTDLPLTAGWHQVQIEFFQASSESRLQFQAATKGQPLQDVPVTWLRPAAARPPRLDLSANAALAEALQDALKGRAKVSLRVPVAVPPALAGLTNEIPNENLVRLARESLSAGATLASNLVAFSAWRPEDSHQAETQADYLTGVSKEALKILRDELEKVRWRYEGAAALKAIKIALDELREANQELRQQHQNRRKERSEEEQAKIDLAKVWQKQLERATAKAAHALFETAKQNDSTLAARVAALNAAARLEKDLHPEADRLADTLNGNSTREEMVKQVDHSLNTMQQAYNKVNELQEQIERERIASEARKAFPVARTFARAQSNGNDPEFAAKHARMREAVEKVEQAQRVSGYYEDARRLDSHAGTAPEQAKGKQTADELRDLALRTDNNPPSLAQSIPPPMQEEGEAMEKRSSPPTDSASQLARPRLAMALEAARLGRQRERKTAVAYEFLGQDLGNLIQDPAKLNAASLAPLTERARALAGQKGDEARKAEIAAANQRLADLSKEGQQNATALAARLDELSTEARDAAGQERKRQPLSTALDELAGTASHPLPWTEAVNPAQIASGAAAESLAGIEAAPKAWESYNDASQTLAEAARQVRMDAALGQVDALNPYPSPEAATLPDPTDALAAAANERVKMDGPAGKALNQTPPRAMDNGDWARLAERLRQAIRNGGIEHFSEEQQAAIRAYFEKISADQ